MKQLYLTLLFCLLLPTLMRAEVLAIEDFNYPLGDDLTQHGWFTSWGAASGITVTNGLEMAGFAGCGVGGAAVIDVISSSAQPHLPFRQHQAGDLYVSFLLQPTINQKSGYFFCLRDSLLSGNTFNYNARVFLSEDYRLGLTFADNQKAVYSTYLLNPQKVYQLVLKYSVVPGNNNDSVSLYVFLNGTPRPNQEALATPILSGIQDANKTDITPAHVVLRGYDANNWLVIDGIRVATTWQEAIGHADTGDCGQEQTNLTNPSQADSPRKFIQNGQLFILHDGHLLNAMGQTIQ